MLRVEVARRQKKHKTFHLYGHAPTPECLIVTIMSNKNCNIELILWIMEVNYCINVWK